MVSAVSSLTQPVLDTFHAALAPLRFIIEKIKEMVKNFFGFVVRIITFQMGLMHETGAWLIMRLYSMIFDPPQVKAFDAARLQASKDLLLEFGGRESILTPSDGNATVHAMTFRSADFFAKFRELGSVPIDVNYQGRPRKALIDAPDVAAKFYFPFIDIQMPDGSVRRGALLPESPPPSEVKPHILYCHSPGRSMCMDRKFLGLHLGAGGYDEETPGYDVTVFDYRGVAESEGPPSEGGYYLDADAVLEHIVDNYDVPIDRIYAAGYCKGAAVAAYLKRKYHAQGINYIASNPYTSMKDVIEDHGFIARMAAYFGMDAIKDPNLDVEQDYFSNAEKLRNLPRGTGKVIFLHTDTDSMMPRGTVQKLIDIYGEAGPAPIEILRTHPDPSKNGHMFPPYEGEEVWRRYRHFVT